MYYLISVTPILGLLRNYTKYKKIDRKLFLRTPILSLIIYKLFLINNFKEEKYFYLSLIIERWFLLAYKGLYSYFNKDYIKKKEKYIKKYNISYDE
jgi:hypothetical protein